MKRATVVAVLMIALSACDQAKWVDVPSPVTCDELKSMDQQKEMWAKATCLQIKKAYTGEARCESGSNIQVMCK